MVLSLLDKHQDDAMGYSKLSKTLISQIKVFERSSLKPEFSDDLSCYIADLVMLGFAVGFETGYLRSCSKATTKVQSLTSQLHHSELKLKCLEAAFTKSLENMFVPKNCNDSVPQSKEYQGGSQGKPVQHPNVARSPDFFQTIPQGLPSNTHAGIFAGLGPVSEGSNPMGTYSITDGKYLTPAEVNQQMLQAAVRAERDAIIASQTPGSSDTTDKIWKPNQSSTSQASNSGFSAAAARQAADMGGF